MVCIIRRFEGHSADASQPQRADRDRPMHCPYWPSARRLAVRVQPICSPEGRNGSATGERKNLQCDRNQGVVRYAYQVFCTVWPLSRNYQVEQCGETADREALVQACITAGQRLLGAGQAEVVSSSGVAPPGLRLWSRQDSGGGRAPVPGEKTSCTSQHGILQARRRQDAALLPGHRRAGGYCPWLCCVAWECSAPCGQPLSLGMPPLLRKRCRQRRQ
jgi:hypothetical protein